MYKKLFGLHCEYHTLREITAMKLTIVTVRAFVLNITSVQTPTCIKSSKSKVITVLLKYEARPSNHQADLTSRYISIQPEHPKGATLGDLETSAGAPYSVLPTSRAPGPFVLSVRCRGPLAPCPFFSLIKVPGLR